MIFKGRPGLRRLKEVRLLVFDLDGVFTDGAFYLGPGGGEWKRIGYRDLDGYFLLRRLGHRTAIISGEGGELAQLLAGRLKADHQALGCKTKLAALEEICAAEKIPLAKVAYIGDSIHDLDVLHAAGLGIVPADGHPRAKRAARWILKNRGGHDAISEMAEAFLPLGRRTP